MVHARISSWKYTRGHREEGVRTLDELVASTARTTKGFRGALTLLSADEPDAATIITLWETEDDLKASGRGVFQDAVGKVKQFLASPPEVKSFKLDSAEIHL